MPEGGRFGHQERGGQPPAAHHAAQLGSMVTWRRAQMLLLSAQSMDVAQIANVVFTSPDRVREVLHNFNEDGFESLYPRYSGGRSPPFTLPQRQQIKRIRSPAPRITTCPSGPGACPSWPSSWSPTGGRRHQARGPAGAAPRGGRVL